MASGVLEKHAQATGPPANKPETFPHCLVKKVCHRLGSERISSAVAFLMFLQISHSRFCIFLDSSLAHAVDVMFMSFSFWRSSDVTRHSAANYIL